MNLNQVTVPCTDFEASADFYRRLGLRQIVSSPPRYARFECPGGATLSIHAVAGPLPEPAVVVYFEVEDVDATVAGLQAAGMEFAAMPVDQDWLWREAYLLDPAGNRICIYHAGENRRFPPWRIA